MVGTKKNMHKHNGYPQLSLDPLTFQQSFNFFLLSSFCTLDLKFEFFLNLGYFQIFSAKLFIGSDKTSQKGQKTTTVFYY